MEDIQNVGQSENPQEDATVKLEQAVKPVSSLSRLVQLGLESENEMGMVLRAVKLGVSSSLCSIVSEMHSMSTSSMNIMRQLKDRYDMLLEEELPMMSREECFEEFDKLSGQVMEIAKLEQRIAQGSQDLYPEDTFSAEDRKLLRLFSSLGSSEDKAEVMRILEAKFGSAEGFTDVEATDSTSGDYSESLPKKNTKGKRVLTKVQGVDAAGTVGADAQSFDAGTASGSTEFSQVEE